MQSATLWAGLFEKSNFLSVKISITSVAINLIFKVLDIL